MRLKKTICILLTVCIMAALFGTIAFAEGEKPRIYLEDATAYAVKRNETEITVPIYVDGEIDMQCFNIKVTYDKAALTPVTEKTGIYMKEETEYSYYDMNTATAGEIVFAGVTVDESAKNTSGQIGELVFTSRKSITDDGVTSTLGLSVEELGFGTEVADIEVKADATITMNSSEDPNPPQPPEPSDEVQLGDVNQDTNVTSADALLILQHAAQLTKLEGDAYTAADVNSDNTVNANDALEVLRYAAGLIKDFGN